MKPPREVVDYGPYPRSVLTSAVPLGAGTGQLESLRSYVARLLVAHRTTRYQLDRFVWERAGARAPACLYYTRRNYDTPCVASYRFARCLADLTRQPVVARLGLGFLHAGICSNDSLRKRLAWCDACLLESVEKRRPPHLPLLWSLACVQACPVHRRLLMTECPSCGWADSTMAPLLHPFLHCPRCGTALAASAATGLASEPSVLQFRVADHLSDFVRDLQQLRPSEEVQGPNLRAAVDVALTQGVFRSRYQFSQVAGFDTRRLTGVAAGGQTSLNLCARVSLTAGVSLAGLFAPQLWKRTPSGEAVGLGEWRRKYSRLDLKAVADAFDRELKAEYPKSPKALLASLGLHRQHWTTKPLEASIAALSAAYRAGQTRLRNEKVDALIKRLVVEAERLREEGMKPSAQTLARLVGLDYTNVPFTLAIRQMAATLGPAYADYGRKRILKRHFWPLEVSEPGNMAKR